MCRLSGSGGEWELWSVVSVVSCTCDRGRMLGVPSPSLSHRHTHVCVPCRQWKVGDPSDPTVKMGALISKEHLAKVKGYLEVAQQEGAAILCGGSMDTLELPEKNKKVWGEEGEGGREGKERGGEGRVEKGGLHSRENEITISTGVKLQFPCSSVHLWCDSCLSFEVLALPHCLFCLTATESSTIMPWRCITACQYRCVG